MGLSLLPLSACAEDATFMSKGVKIRYVMEGEGVPIVLIHGWMSDSSMWGRDAAGNTKLNTSGVEGFKVIALDCRGHGQSEKLYDTKNYGVEMAEDVVRLLDHLKLRKAHLVGYSMGAFIAGNVAARYPQRVLSVVYGGQAPILEGSANGSREVDSFDNAVRAGKGLGSYLIDVIPPGMPKPTLEQANLLASHIFAGKDTRALAAAGKSFDNLKVKLSDLKKCKAPSLFLYGEKEPEALKQRVNELRMSLFKTSEKVIAGADHITTLTKPEFGSSLVAFLRTHKLRK